MMGIINDFIDFIEKLFKGEQSKEEVEIVEKIEKMDDNFEKVFEKMQDFEGGYANHSSDSGGETYRGIARNAWPNWKGWKEVDKVVPHKFNTAIRSTRDTVDDINEKLGESDSLDKSVKEFYRKNFWEAVRADELPDRIARKVFDASVNVGTRRGKKFLQKALNRCGNNLLVDGQLGKNTLAAINKSDEDCVIQAYIRIQANFYRRIATKGNNRIFLRGWLRRAAYDGS